MRKVPVWNFFGLTPHRLRNIAIYVGEKRDALVLKMIHAFLNYFGPHRTSLSLNSTTSEWAPRSRCTNKLWPQIVPPPPTPKKQHTQWTDKNKRNICSNLMSMQQTHVSHWVARISTLQLQFPIAEQGFRPYNYYFTISYCRTKPTKDCFSRKMTRRRKLEFNLKNELLELQVCVGQDESKSNIGFTQV